VEETFDNDHYSPGPDLQVPVKTWKEPRYCQDYQISASGKALKVQWQAEDKTSNNGGKVPPFKGITGWMVSELTFTGGQEMPVLIRFCSTYPESHYGSSGDASSSGAYFNYRLSTAACWAGTIGSGHITLKPAGIDPRKLSVLKPVNRFHKVGESWVWDFENLEPTLADDLVVEAAPVVHSHWGGEHHGNYYETKGEWSMITTNYKAKASSTLPPDGDITYDVKNLNDYFTNNAWTEGKPGPGVGEWLELRPEVAKPLRAILMKPGYQKSAELFRNNARPKKVKVTLNGEHSFTADVPDKRAECVMPVCGYDKPVSVIKLVFEEVWPGTKFEDLCVSGVRLEVKLDKKPKLPQVR